MIFIYFHGQIVSGIRTGTDCIRETRTCQRSNHFRIDGHFPGQGGDCARLIRQFAFALGNGGIVHLIGIIGCMRIRSAAADTGTVLGLIRGQFSVLLRILGIIHISGICNDDLLILLHGGKGVVKPGRGKAGSCWCH